MAFTKNSHCIKGTLYRTHIFLNYIGKFIFIQKNNGLSLSASSCGPTYSMNE